MPKCKRTSSSSTWVCHEWHGQAHDAGSSAPNIKTCWREKRRRPNANSKTQHSNHGWGETPWNKDGTSCEMMSLPSGPRHLCDRGCFFWAYEPARNAALLRAKLSATGACLSVCNGWTVQVERVVGRGGGGRGGGGGGEGGGGRSTEATSEGKLHVIFVSPCGIVYSSMGSALSALKFAETTFRKGNDTEHFFQKHTDDEAGRSESFGSKIDLSSPWLGPFEPAEGWMSQEDEITDITISKKGSSKRCPFFKDGSSAGHSLACFVRLPKWKPPSSPFGLLEEILWQDPWKLLVGCMLLNRTNRRKVDAVLFRLFETFPTSRAMSSASPKDVEAIIEPLGLQRRRSSTFVKMSQAFVSEAWRQPEDLPGIGAYASDAYALFVTGAWRCRSRLPADYALLLYRGYLDNAAEGNHQ